MLAQAGALLHASSHVDEPRDRGSAHAQLCIQCLSYAGVLSMAGGGPHPALVLPAGGTAALLLAAAGPVADGATPRAFRSRAPPRPY
jgi:hypothetical protein